MTYLLRTHMNKKYLVSSLQMVYGIGPFLSKKICNSLGLQPNFLLKSLNDEQKFNLAQCVEDLQIPIKGELQRVNRQKVERLVVIRTLRGIRSRQGLPVRGQRTHTNARTQKRLKGLRR